MEPRVAYYCRLYALKRVSNADSSTWRAWMSFMPVFAFVVNPLTHWATPYN